MQHQVNVKSKRRAYEPPSMARVIVDPVKEMLVVCEVSPGKTNPPPLGEQCGDGTSYSCCSVGS